MPMVVVAAIGAPNAQAAEPLSAALATLKQVGHDGAGNRAATQAWAIVAAANAAQLPAILTALDDAGPLAANYLRAATDAVAERTLRKATSFRTTNCNGSCSTPPTPLDRAGWRSSGWRKSILRRPTG